MRRGSGARSRSSSSEGKGGGEAGTWLPRIAGLSASGSYLCSNKYSYRAGEITAAMQELPTAERARAGCGGCDEGEPQAAV